MTDSLNRRYSFFLVNYFIQGAVGVIYEPLNYILKDHLHLTPGQASGFIALMSFPLLLKPLFGFVTDFVPIAGYRRKPHLVLSAILASAAFLGLAAQTQYAYWALLFPVTLSVFAMAFAEVVCGGLLVEDGKERQQTGAYQAIHIGSLYLSAMLVGVGGGWLTSHISFRWIFGVAGLLPLIIAASVGWIQETPGVHSRSIATKSLMGFVKTKAFWMLCLTILLWNFYPFLGTVQFYYQSNILHLNPQWIGSLMTIGCVAGFLGSGAYWKFCRGKDIRIWVSWGPVGMAFVSLTYLFYFGPISVSVVESLFGFASVFFRLALLDLIARSCPADAEATSYALLLTCFDIAMYGSNAIGGKLYDFLQRHLALYAQHDRWSAVILIVMGSLCTLSCRWTLKFSRTATT